MFEQDRQLDPCDKCGQDKKRTDPTNRKGQQDPENKKHQPSAEDRK